MTEIDRLSVKERKWYDILKGRIEDTKQNGYCSWWLRLDMEAEGYNIPTSTINYWLGKLADKGLLRVYKTKSYTKFYLNETTPTDT